MAKVPRVVLLLYPYAGYDRGILPGSCGTRGCTAPGCSIWRAKIRACPLPDAESVNGDGGGSLFGWGSGGGCACPTCGSGVPRGSSGDCRTAKSPARACACQHTVIL